MEEGSHQEWSPGVPIAKQKVEMSSDGNLPLEKQWETLECPCLSPSWVSSGLHQSSF